MQVFIVVNQFLHDVHVHVHNVRNHMCCYFVSYNYNDYVFDKLELDSNVSINNNILFTCLLLSIDQSQV